MKLTKIREHVVVKTTICGKVYSHRRGTSGKSVSSDMLIRGGGRRRMSWWLDPTNTGWLDPTDTGWLDPTVAKLWPWPCSPFERLLNKRYYLYYPLIMD